MFDGTLKTINSVATTTLVPSFNARGLGNTYDCGTASRNLPCSTRGKACRTQISTVQSQLSRRSEYGADRCVIQGVCRRQALPAVRRVASVLPVQGRGRWASEHRGKRVLKRPARAAVGVASQQP